MIITCRHIGMREQLNDKSIYQQPLSSILNIQLIKLIPLLFELPKLFWIHLTASYQNIEHIFFSRPDIAIVSSIFFNDSSKRIDLWIIIGSALIGFLLLLIFTFGLTKVIIVSRCETKISSSIWFQAGFFKRTRKEELEQMKAQVIGKTIISLNLYMNILRSLSEILSEQLPRQQVTIIIK